MTIYLLVVFISLLYQSLDFSFENALVTLSLVKDILVALMDKLQCAVCLASLQTSSDNADIVTSSNLQFFLVKMENLMCK